MDIAPLVRISKKKRQRINKKIAQQKQAELTSKLEEEKEKSKEVIRERLQSRLNAMKDRRTGESEESNQQQRQQKIHLGELLQKLNITDEDTINLIAQKAEEGKIKSVSDVMKLAHLLVSDPQKATSVTSGVSE
jgi:hypothetical protein